MKKNKLIILIISAIILCFILKLLLPFLETSNFFYNAKYNLTIYLSYVPQSICLLFIILFTYKFSLFKILKSLPKATNLNILHITYLYIFSLEFYVFYIALLLFVEILLQGNYKILNYEFPTLIYKDFVVLSHTIIIIPFLSTLIFYHIILNNLTQFYSFIKSMVITLLILILFHIDPEHIIFEFTFISIILSYIYVKLGFWYSFLFYVFLNFNSVYVTKYIFSILKNLTLEFNVYVILIILIISIILLAYTFLKILSVNNLKGKIEKKTV